MRRCLVLGGGLLGSHIARHLCDAGYDVSLFSRSLNPWLDESRRGGIEIHLGRIETETGLLEELVDAADYVIHLASSSRPPLAARAPLVDVDQTVTPALIVMELVARTAGSKMFLQLLLRRDGVRGTPRVSDPRDASVPADDAVCHHARRARALRGLLPPRTRARLDHHAFLERLRPGRARCAAARVSSVTWLHQIAIGERPVLLERISVSRDFVFIEDAAAAVTALVDQGRTGRTYNVGSNTTTSLLDLLELVEAGHGGPDRARTRIPASDYSAIADPDDAPRHDA